VATRTLSNENDRADIVRRLGQLRPETRALWGTLDAPRMVCHLADQLRVAVGDLPSRPANSLLGRTLLKYLVVHTGFQPPKGKVKTAPEMLSTTPAAWADDLQACRALIERVGTGAAAAPHPMFGPLTSDEWGKLCWKHLDYHLRQFDV
jgi:hypothetical protein